MTGWDWFGLIIFVIILMLLFFAAFGGTSITDESVEEYMKRLMSEDAKKGLNGAKAGLSVLFGKNHSQTAIWFLCGFNRTS